MSLNCILQPNTLMQIAFRFKMGIHKWYLGTGGVGYLCYYLTALAMYEDMF